MCPQKKKSWFQTSLSLFCEPLRSFIIQILSLGRPCIYGMGLCTDYLARVDRILYYLRTVCHVQQTHRPPLIRVLVAPSSSNSSVYFQTRSPTVLTNWKRLQLGSMSSHNFKFGTQSEFLYAEVWEDHASNIISSHWCWSMYDRERDLVQTSRYVTQVFTKSRWQIKTFQHVWRTDSNSFTI